jgi:hypothetical protein
VGGREGSGGLTGPKSRKTSGAVGNDRALAFADDKTATLICQFVSHFGNARLVEPRNFFAGGVTSRLTDSTRRRCSQKVYDLYGCDLYYLFTIVNRISVHFRAALRLR